MSCDTYEKNEFLTGKGGGRRPGRDVEAKRSEDRL